MYTLHAHFICALYMYTLHLHFTCALYITLYMCTLHVHFTCTLYICTLHVHFTCALYMCTSQVMCCTTVTLLVALWLNASRGLLIIDVSRSRTTKHHIW